MSVVDRLWEQRFDTGAAVLGLVAALAMFPLRFIASQIYIQTVPIVLGVACALYLLAAHRTSETRAARYGTENRTLPSLPTPAARLLPSATFVLVAAMIAVAGLSGERSRLFLDLSTVAGTLLLAQPLLTAADDFNPRLFLLEVVVFAVVVRFAALLTTPGLIGLDVWTHITTLAADIMRERSLAAINGDKHYASPLYHLLVVSASLLYDVPLRQGLFFSVGVLLSVASLLVYATGRLLVEPRWAAFAAAVYSVSSYVVQWGLHLIPTSMGLALFLLVLYFLLRHTRTGSVRDLLALLAATVAVVLTHQVSSFIMLVLIGGALVAGLAFRIPMFATSRFNREVFRAQDPVNVGGVLVFDTGLIIFVWSLTPFHNGTFLGTVLSYLEETLVSSAGFLNLASGPSGSSGAATAAPSLLDTIALYVDTVGFLFLLCGTFVGCLYVVHRKRAHQSVFTLLIATAVMLVFVLGLPLFGIRNFIPQRWFAFMYAPMALLTAIGFRYLARALDRRLFVAVMVLFVVVFPGAMLLSSNATIDNPTFEQQWEQLSYSQSELAAVDAVARMTGSPGPQNILPNEVLFTDHPYKTVFRRTGSYPSDTAIIGATNRTGHPLVVYRHKETTEATYFSDGHGNAVLLNVPRSRVCRPSQSVLYENGDVSICLNRSAVAG